MKRASISEAKNGLSALLDRVKNGQSIVIEDRGVPVARLEPVIADASEAAGRTTRLERQGIVRRPSSGLEASLLRTRPPGARGGRRASAVLIAERDEGR